MSDKQDGHNEYDAYVNIPLQIGNSTADGIEQVDSKLIEEEKVSECKDPSKEIGNQDQTDEVDEQVNSSKHGGESPERQESIVQFQAKTDDESKHEVPETKGQEAADIDDMEKELERIVARDESLKVAEK